MSNNDNNLKEALEKAIAETDVTELLKDWFGRPSAMPRIFMPSEQLSIATSDLASEKARILELGGDRPVLVVTVGLPHSGKTTWARLTGWTTVNTDMTRLAFQGRPFIQETEGWIWMVVRVMVKVLILTGNNPVILDGMFVTKKSREDWLNPNLYRVVYRVFPVSAQECIRRALLNERMELVDNFIDRSVQNWEVVGDEHLYYPSEGALWKP